MKQGTISGVMAAVAACGLALAVVAGCGSAGPAGAPPSNAPAAGTQPAGLSLDSFPPMPAGPAPGASAQVRELARALNGGINFGNMLEPPKEGDWGLTVTQEFIDLIGQPGFTNAVRLPVRWSNHASADAAAVIDEKFFQRVDAVLAALLAKGATVVLDMHHYRQFDGDALDPGEAPVADAVVDVRLLSMWKQIAQRYANHSPRLIFEIYNEPHGRSEPRWNDMLSRALRVIRQSNPERAVVIGPTLWNSATRLNQLVLPPDPNLIITVHHYEPFDFTHQGAEWITPPKPTGVDCCNAAQTQQIQELLDAAAQYARKTGYPVFVGEFGAYGKASPAARVRYLQTLRSAMQARQIPWMYWELAAGFGLYAPAAKAFRTDLKAALYPTP